MEASHITPGHHNGIALLDSFSLSLSPSPSFPPSLSLSVSPLLLLHTDLRRSFASPFRPPRFSTLRAPFSAEVISASFSVSLLICHGLPVVPRRRPPAANETARDRGE